MGQIIINPKYPRVPVQTTECKKELSQGERWMLIFNAKLLKIFVFKIQNAKIVFFLLGEEEADPWALFQNTECEKLFSFAREKG